MNPVAPLPWPVQLDAAACDLYGQTRALGAQLAPTARHDGAIDRPLLKALATQGLLPRLFPASHGGAEEGPVSAITLCLLREALATGSPEAETALALQGLGGYPILEAAGPELAGRWIPAIASGRAVAAFALTEPGAGSDAAALATKAERDGDGWRLSGEKAWISNAPDADVYTVFARTGTGPGSKGVSAFVVPGDAGGLSGERLEMLASHPMGRLAFDGVYVPGDHLIGEPGHGFRVALGTLSRFRPSVGAFALGMAQAALEAAIAHADDREAFGGMLRDLQSVSHKLAEMAVRLHAARLTVYDAAAAFDQGRDRLAVRSSAAKLVATETAQFVVDAAIQVHGARALERGHLLERLYRDVRAPRIYEGASEVQLTVVGREMYRAD